MRDQSEWIQIERPELAVVPAELWNRVQARLNLHGAKPAEGRRRGLFARGFTSPYLFSGLLKCGECGANLIVGTGDLPPPAVQRLAAITSAAAYPKGATLFVEGQSPRGVFIFMQWESQAVDLVCRREKPYSQDIGIRRGLGLARHGYGQTLRADG